MGPWPESFPSPTFAVPARSAASVITPSEPTSIVRRSTPPPYERLQANAPVPPAYFAITAPGAETGGPPNAVVVWLQTPTTKFPAGSSAMPAGMSWPASPIARAQTRPSDASSSATRTSWVVPIDGSNVAVKTTPSRSIVPRFPWRNRPPSGAAAICATSKLSPSLLKALARTVAPPASSSITTRSR